MAYGDPVEAAKQKMIPKNGSFFPAVNMRLFNDRTDLAKEAENAFYGGGNASAPTPTPMPQVPWWHWWDKQAAPTPAPKSNQMFGLGLNRYSMFNNRQQPY